MSGVDFEYAIKKDVRNNPIVREVDAARQRQIWRSLWVGGLLVVVVLFSAWQNSELIQHGYNMQRLQAESRRTTRDQPPPDAGSGNAPLPGADREDRERDEADLAAARSSRRHRASDPCRAPRQVDHRCRANRISPPQEYSMAEEHASSRFRLPWHSCPRRSGWRAETRRRRRSNGGAPCARDCWCVRLSSRLDGGDRSPPGLPAGGGAVGDAGHGRQASRPGRSRFRAKRGGITDRQRPTARLQR